MATIEVACECGRVYVLPTDKEGRKLQCRRCGAVVRVQREAEPGTVVPFAAPVAEEPRKVKTKAIAKPAPSSPRAPISPAAPEAPRKAAAPGELELREPLRRCPACGHQDDPDVPVCARCRYDWATRRRPDDSAEIERREVHRRELDGEASVRRVEVASRLGFIPIVGLFPGLWSILLGFGPARRGLEELPVPARRGLEARLDAARLVGVATVLIWLGLLGWFFGFFLPGRDHETREWHATRCRARLEEVGRRIQTIRAASGRFPAEAPKGFRGGLEDLVARQELDANAVFCPVPPGQPFGLTNDLETTGIDARTAEEHVVAWDPEPHVGARGEQVWRVLRADGRVEEARGLQAFDRARSRPARRPEPIGGAGDSPGGKQPAGPPRTPPPPGFVEHKKAIIAFAAELDGKDPKGDLRLTAADFSKRVPLSPSEAVGIAVNREDPALVRALAAILARLEASGPELAKLVLALDAVAEPDVQLGLIATLRRASEPGWLARAANVALTSSPPANERALALIVDEATGSREGLRRVLQLARDRRPAGSAADLPIFALPPPVYGSLAEVIFEDETIAAEAAAVLSRGGAEVLEALDPAFARATTTRSRELLFRVLRANLAWREVSLKPYHDRLRVEPDRSVKARALLAVATQDDPDALARALEALREPGGDELWSVAKKVIANVRSRELLGELLGELDRATPGRDEVAAELRRPPRILDDVVGEVLLARTPRLESVQAHELAIQIAAERFDEPAHRLLLREATSSATASVRDAACKVLFDNSARLSPKVRLEVGTELAPKVNREPDPNVRNRLFQIASERVEYRTTAGLAALEQIARRSAEAPALRERALNAIGQFSEPRAVTVLADLIDGLKDNMRWVCTLNLKRMTGITSSPSSTADWKRVLASSEAEVKKALKDREQRDTDDLERRQQAARDRLKELEGRSTRGS